MWRHWASPDKTQFLDALSTWKQILSLWVLWGEVFLCAWSRLDQLAIWGGCLARISGPALIHPVVSFPISLPHNEVVLFVTILAFCWQLLPATIALYLLTRLQNYLKKENLLEMARFFHSHWIRWGFLLIFSSFGMSGPLRGWPCLAPTGLPDDDQWGFFVQRKFPVLL